MHRKSYHKIKLNQIDHKWDRDSQMSLNKTLRNMKLEVDHQLGMIQRPVNAEMYQLIINIIQQ